MFIFNYKLLVPVKNALICLIWYLTERNYNSFFCRYHVVSLEISDFGNFWVLLLGVGPSRVGVGHPLFVVREAGRAIRGWRPLPHTGKNNTLATIWSLHNEGTNIFQVIYIKKGNLAVRTSPSRITQYQGNDIHWSSFGVVPLPTRNLHVAFDKTINTWLRQAGQFSNRVFFSWQR